MCSELRRPARISRTRRPERSGRRTSNWIVRFRHTFTTSRSWPRCCRSPIVGPDSASAVACTRSASRSCWWTTTGRTSWPTCRRFARTRSWRPSSWSSARSTSICSTEFATCLGTWAKAFSWSSSTRPATLFSRWAPSWPPSQCTICKSGRFRLREAWRL